MGKAIIINNCDFSQHNLGQVTFTENVPVVSLSILGLSYVSGNTEATTYTVAYTPSVTTQRNVTWSILSGDTYASISAAGKLTILSNANNSSVIIKVQSDDNITVYDTKEIHVTYYQNSNTITPTVGEDYISVQASNAVSSQLTISVSGDVNSAITIASGETSGITTFATSNVDRVCSLSVSPSADTTYTYMLSTSSVTIPASTSAADFIIVGPDSIEGDISAGNYFILDNTTMKQIVGSSEEATDEYKEFKGTINWSIVSGSSYAEFAYSTGTEGALNVLSNADNSSVIISATIGNLTKTKTITAKYDITDYEITSFADLQAIESAINNGTEGSISLTQTQGSTYTPSNGDGFSGVHFRLSNDINCGGSHVEIGKWNTSLSVTKSFKGIIDGAGKKIYNVGGACGVVGSAAEGGYVGSALIGYGNGCKIKNFTIEGSTSWAGTRGYADLIGIFGGTCYIERVYNKLISSATTAGSGNALFAGWGTSSSDTIKISNAIYAGTRLGSAGSIVGYGQVSNGGANGEVKNCATIGELKVKNVGTAAAHNLTCMFSSGSRGKIFNCYTIAKLETDFPSSSNLYLAGSTTNGFYDASTIGTSFASYVMASEGIISSAYTINNQVTQGTVITSTELKNTEIFTDNSWIHTVGYYPIINNQFAVNPIVLSRAKNGYTE